MKVAAYQAFLEPRKLIHHLIYGAISTLIGHDDIFQPIHIQNIVAFQSNGIPESPECLTMDSFYQYRIVQQTRCLGRSEMLSYQVPFGILSVNAVSRKYVPD